jgi:hypothetical protein
MVDSPSVSIQYTRNLPRIGEFGKIATGLPWPSQLTNEDSTDPMCSALAWLLFVARWHEYERSPWLPQNRRWRTPARRWKCAHAVVHPIAHARSVPWQGGGVAEPTTMTMEKILMMDATPGLKILSRGSAAETKLLARSKILRDVILC